MTTVEDYHRARYLYQLTAAGQAAEQAIAVYEEAIGRRGSLQSVALADIAAQLRALADMAEGTDLDPVKVHLLLLGLAERFAGLADSAQTFMASLRRVIDFADGDIDAFVAYKQRLIDYINRFIADLANRGAEIATILTRIESADVERLLLVAARREAADAVPDLPDEDGPADSEPTDAHESAVTESFNDWRNRWRGLATWCHDVARRVELPAVGAPLAELGAFVTERGVVPVPPGRTTCRRAACRRSVTRRR